MLINFSTDTDRKGGGRGRQNQSNTTREFFLFLFARALEQKHLLNIIKTFNIFNNNAYFIYIYILIGNYVKVCVPVSIRYNTTQ